MRNSNEGPKRIFNYCGPTPYIKYIVYMGGGRSNKIFVLRRGGLLHGIIYEN